MIMALETHFGRVQIFSGEPAFANTARSNGRARPSIKSWLLTVTASTNSRINRMIDLYLLACLTGVGATVLGWFGTCWKAGEKRRDLRRISPIAPSIARPAVSRRSSPARTSKTPSQLASKQMRNRRCGHANKSMPATLSAISNKKAPFVAAGWSLKAQTVQQGAFFRRLTNVHVLFARSGGWHPNCLRDLGFAVQAPAEPQTEVRQMFVIYVMDNETHDYLIFTRPKRPRLAVMYNNGSTWMVPGTESADE